MIQTLRWFRTTTDLKVGSLTCFQIRYDQDEDQILLQYPDSTDVIVFNRDLEDMNKNKPCKFYLAGGHNDENLFKKFLLESVNE